MPSPYEVIARPEVLLDAAEEVGLDRAAMDEMLRHGTVAREFSADLEFARALKAPAMPTVVVRAGDQQLRLVATQPYRRLEQVLLAVTDSEPSNAGPSWNGRCLRQSRPFVPREEP